MAKETTQVDWDAKDRRIVRQNALSHATNLVIAGLVQDVSGDPVVAVKNVAEDLVNWVYEKDSKPISEDPMPTPKQKEILDKFENKYGISKEQVLEAFGRLPSNTVEATNCLSKIQG